MPCADRQADQETVDELLKQGRFFEASLCAVFSGLKQAGTLDDVFNHDVDWKEAGVTPEAVWRWWDEHQCKDKERRKEIQQKALAKLTPEEIKVLREFGL